MGQVWSSSRCPGHVTQFWGNRSKLRSHGHVMYTAEMSITSDPIQDYSTTAEGHLIKKVTDVLLLF